MLINLKAQVEVKVRKGAKDKIAEPMMDELADRLNQVLLDFMTSHGQNPALYCFQVKEATSLMRLTELLEN